jgi:hypothetical protein
MLYDIINGVVFLTFAGLYLFALFIWSATEIEDDFLRVNLIAATSVMAAIFLIATIYNGDALWGVAIASALAIPVTIITVLVLATITMLNNKK